MSEPSANPEDFEKIQQDAIRFLLRIASAETGLIADSSRDEAPCSIAATGLGLAAFVVGAERGVLPRREAVARTLTALRFLRDSPQGEEPDATGHRGFYYHFLDMKTGRRKRLSSLIIPWCTYTDPEIAHVGLYVNECHAQSFPIKTFTVPLGDVDRAILDGEEEGFVKIHFHEGTDTILGSTIVARHAGEMINEISLAMVAGIGLKTVSQVIHSYPTQAEAIRKASDAYNHARLSPLVRGLGRRWLAWSRRSGGFQ